MPVLLKHVQSLMVGEHGGHCFLGVAVDLAQVLSVRVGPAFGSSRVFDQLKIERIFTDRLAASSRFTDHF